MTRLFGDNAVPAVVFRLMRWIIASAFGVVMGTGAIVTIVAVACAFAGVSPIAFLRSLPDTSSIGAATPSTTSNVVGLLVMVFYVLLSVWFAHFALRRAFHRP
jgi:hypothetical protein